MLAKNIAHHAILAEHTALFTTAADLLRSTSMDRKPHAPSNDASGTTRGRRSSSSTR